MTTSTRPSLPRTLSDVELAARRWNRAYQTYSDAYYRERELTRELYRYSNSLGCRRSHQEQLKIEAMWREIERADAEVSRLSVEFTEAQNVAEAFGIDTGRKPAR